MQNKSLPSCFPVCDYVKHLFLTNEICSKPSVRVPYKKGGFEVLGLPSGLNFKRPSAYGSRQIKKIMKSANNIAFKILPSKASAPAALDINDKPVMYEKVLSKVVGKEKAAACLSKQEKIVEEEIEVLDVDLLSSEFFTLETEPKHCFDEDAFAAVKSNYETGRNHCGYILPVYPGSDETYWLFFYPGNAENIENLQVHDKVQGYWLDKTSNELCYKLLVGRRKVYIVGLNLVSNDPNELGSLRLKITLDANDGAQITIPREFDESIKESIKQQSSLYMVEKE